MDPNNNQPINSNPLEQPTAPQPVQPVMPQPNPQQSPFQAPPQPFPTPSPVQPEMYQAAPPVPPRRGKKIYLLLLILLILILGMVSYIFFAKNQLNKEPTPNTSVVIPTTIPTVTPATVDEVNVASPDADLKDLENDVQGL